MPAHQARTEPLLKAQVARFRRKGTRKPYGFRPSTGSTYTTLSLALITALALATAYDPQLVSAKASIYSVGGGFAVAYAAALGYVAALNRQRFCHWAARTYGLKITWWDAGLLLHGHWVQETHTAVTDGLTFLHSMSGELPRLTLPTMEIPVVATS